MALIKCPECGKEISDKATNCPSCGCPLENANSNEQSSSQDLLKKDKVNKKIKLIIPIVCIVAIAIIVSIVGIKSKQKKEKQKQIYNEAVELLDKGKTDEAIEKLDSILDYKDAKHLKEKAEEQATYNEALDYLNKADYENAHKLLLDIPDYEGVEELQEQIHYETRVYQGLMSIKENLKNPDSLQFYDCIFVNNTPKEDTNPEADEVIQKMFEEVISGEPILIIHYGAQNGLGGNTESIAVVLYTETGYQKIASCHTLDIDKVDDDEYDICWFINYLLDNYEIEGNIDENRIKSILKDSNYSSIKIIE